MPITVILELKVKPEAVSEARDVMRRALQDTRAFDGTSAPTCSSTRTTKHTGFIYELWESVEHDEAYRKFRAGEGRITELPPLLAAPPVKTRYVSTDI